MALRTSITDRLNALPAEGGIVQLETGEIRQDVEWPDKPNVTLRGAGADATRIEGRIKFPGGSRITNWRIMDLSVHGDGTGIGIHIIDGDRGELNSVRVSVFDTCVQLDSTIDLGALHNDILRCRITNANNVCLHLTSAQGPHQTHVHGGEISISKGVGLQVDAPTDNTEVFGTAFESNKQALKVSGMRGHYLGIRLEGNESDVWFTKGSSYNELTSGFFDGDRHRDDNDPTSNIVKPYGHWTSQTEPLPLKYIPADPMTLPLVACVAGARVAVSHLFEVYEAFPLRSLSIVPSGQKGYIDIAICDLDGTPIVTTGPVALGAAGRWQQIKLPKVKWLGPARRYYIVAQVDNNVAAYYGVVSTIAGFQLGQGQVLARQKALNAFPIAKQNCVSRGSGTTIVPAFALA